jgi:hypothetical protein
MEATSKAKLTRFAYLRSHIDIWSSSMVKNTVAQSKYNGKNKTLFDLISSLFLPSCHESWSCVAWSVL